MFSQLISLLGVTGNSEFYQNISFSNLFTSYPRITLQMVAELTYLSNLRVLWKSFKFFQ